MKKIEESIYDLCNEVDYWRGEAKYWQEKYEKEVKDFNSHVNEQLEISKKGVANALMFALSVTEDGDGNLIIPSENRSSLADSFRS